MAISYIKERLDLYQKGLKNLNNVVEGRFNAFKAQLGVLSPDVEAEAKRRLTICLGCPFSSLHAATSDEYFQLTGTHYQTTREEDHCSLCSCPHIPKAMAMHDNCGLVYWNHIHPEQYTEPFWLAYTSTNSPVNNG